MAADAEPSFRAFLPLFQEATRTLLDGDDTVWGGMLSTEPGSTLFGPFGEVASGVEAVATRYELVEARFAYGPARLDVEYLAVDVSGDLAYVVALERSTFRFAESDSMSSGYTRATMVFRREGGEWRLRHRHMDHIEAP